MSADILLQLMYLCLFFASLLFIAIILQFSLTHGFLPYGSSDVLVSIVCIVQQQFALRCLALQLPSLVAFIWGTELLPRYGGVVDVAQYGLWIGM